MPTSPYVHIQTFVDYLIETRPNSILDIGMGNGKLGYVARDLLDVMLGERYRRELWKVRIDGIEVFEDYIQRLHREIYDNIYIGDAFEKIEELGTYDAIFIGDVLEHFEKPKAWEFLDRCIAHTDGHLIINIPLGPEWEQPVIYNNPFEQHRSQWIWPDFQPFTYKYEVFEIYPGAYGSFLIRKGDYLDYKIQNLGKI
jgi:SAM-dependent methyltransferase